ncbi:hypothetical protein RIF29_06808 [Crotalaria pallida]|uniref:Uncharacterized protein n=1 Tax=Crotalaria pallida TaxID=3830 RepID=A0AAN9J3Q8_CROPI
MFFFPHHEISVYISVGCTSFALLKDACISQDAQVINDNVLILYHILLGSLLFIPIHMLFFFCSNCFTQLVTIYKEIMM